VQFDDLENLPFLELEIFTTGASEISLVELVHVGVLEISGEVAGGVG
jgi:hypothetical protein